jgi:cytochrome c nitrite reductase small subunit
MRHAAVFSMRGEPQAIQAIDESAEVIRNNCIRCHTELNTEFVKTGRADHPMVRAGYGKACWDCHRDVPHGRRNSLSSTPSALVPYPKSHVPDWLKNITGQQEE